MYWTFIVWINWSQFFSNSRPSASKFFSITRTILVTKYHFCFKIFSDLSMFKSIVLGISKISLDHLEPFFLTVCCSEQFSIHTMYHSWTKVALKPKKVREKLFFEIFCFNYFFYYFLGEDSNGSTADQVMANAAETNGTATD